MSTLPGGDIASSSSSIGTIGFLGAGQPGERMAERLPADGQRDRLCAWRAEVQRPCPRPSQSAAAETPGNTAGRHIGAERYVDAVTPLLHVNLAADRATAAEVGVTLLKLPASPYDRLMNLGAMAPSENREVR